jgi:hypothetical protein
MVLSKKFLKDTEAFLKEFDFSEEYFTEVCFQVLRKVFSVVEKSDREFREEIKDDIKNVNSEYLKKQEELKEKVIDKFENMSKSHDIVRRSFVNEFSDNKKKFVEEFSDNKKKFVEEFNDSKKKITDQFSEMVKRENTEISTKIADIREEIMLIKESLMKRQTNKGKQAEQSYLALLESNMIGYEVLDVSNTPESCDIKVNSSGNPSILIEIKNYSNNVPTVEVNKFYNDIRKNKSHGIFLSSNTGISLKKDWDIEVIDQRYIVVFISNVNYDPMKVISAVNIIYSYYSKIISLENKRELTKSEQEVILKNINYLENVLKTNKSYALENKKRAEDVIKMLEKDYLTELKKIFSEFETLSPTNNDRLTCKFCLKQISKSAAGMTQHRKRYCLKKETTKDLKNVEVFE